MSEWFAVLVVGVTVGNVALMVANHRLLSQNAREIAELEKSLDQSLDRLGVPPGAPTTTRPDPWVPERRPRPDPWRRAK